MSPATLLISFFVFTLAAVGAVGYLFMLRQARQAPADAGMLPAPPANEPRIEILNQPDLPAAQAAVLDVFRSLGDFVPEALGKPEEARKHLLLAGYRWPSAVPTFIGIKFAVAITFGLAGVWAAATFGGPDTGWLLPGICGVGFGFLVPDRVLDRMARARAARMRRGLAPALDLMLLAVESGQGIDAAILSTSRGLHNTQPDLATEFMQLHLELRAVTTRTDAYRSFAQRIQDKEIKKFTALLIDTDRFGSNLGPALRGHSHYLRTRIRQSAQERARKVAVKLIFPVFFLIFPSVILVTLGPAVIMITQQLGKMLNDF